MGTAVEMNLGAITFIEVRSHWRCDIIHVQTHTLIDLIFRVFSFKMRKVDNNKEWCLLGCYAVWLL
jgi:hypothetical protein